MTYNYICRNVTFRTENNACAHLYFEEHIFNISKRCEWAGRKCNFQMPVTGLWSTHYGTLLNWYAHRPLFIFHDNKEWMFVNIISLRDGTICQVNLINTNYYRKHVGGWGTSNNDPSVINNLEIVRFPCTKTRGRKEVVDVCLLRIMLISWIPPLIK